MAYTLWTHKQFADSSDEVGMFANFTDLVVAALHQTNGSPVTPMDHTFLVVAKRTGKPVLAWQVDQRDIIFATKD